MTESTKRRRSGGRYKPEFCDAVRELGRKGYSILEVAAEVRVPYQTLQTWEKERPEFRAAFAKVRKNSEYRKALRLDKLLSKNEAQLLLALKRVRAKRASEKRKIEERLRLISGVTKVYARANGELAE